MIELRFKLSGGSMDIKKAELSWKDNRTFELSAWHLRPKETLVIFDETNAI